MDQMLSQDCPLCWRKYLKNTQKLIELDFVLKVDVADSYEFAF